ncbi:methylglyoxal reductase (NADPH-dependent) gre2 [Steccherinum ochraceum]|uniref:Methylglyoxal reductase (NADPH-dependent) gre2 n=1 Tax=Steccherinum ochraceum TaxID=92696 RepID=A0A4R0RAI6_9APHY|nr:methylglyoxal reductase (NADPH-dependent) gre2 [Steccherinum ochraceum]
MPTVSSGKILVTGINGFTAMWVARYLLEHGYSVRGTVRSAAKAVHPRGYFKSYGAQIEVIVVEDITKACAFDEAVKDVDGIFHAAASFHLHAEEPSELITPAVEGTVGILHSALKHGNKVKRVIQMSSIAAIEDLEAKSPTIFSEKDWNYRSVEACKKLGRDASPLDMYEASKTLSEAAAWDFMKDNKSTVKFDLVALNPGFLMGTGLQEVDDPMKLNTSLQLFYLGVPMGQFEGEMLTKPSVSWIDMRDFCDAVVASYRVEKAGGERFIVAAEPFCWQDWINVVRNFDSTVPAGNTKWKREDSVYNVNFDTAKVRQILGITYRGWEDSARVVMEYYREKGWWGKKQ